MSWGKTVSGNAADAAQEFAKTSAAYSNMPENEIALLKMIEQQIVPKFCDGLKDPVILEANGSEWGDGRGNVQRTLSLTFRVVPGWIPPTEKPASPQAASSEPAPAQESSGQ